MATADNELQLLLAELESAAGADRVELLLKLCVARRSSAPSDSMSYGQQALDAARELDAPALQARARRELGKTCYYLSSYQDALDHWKSELALHQQCANRKGEQEALHNIGAVYFGISDYSSALEYYHRSLAIKEELEDRHGQATDLINVGLVYARLSEYTKALEYYDRALELVRELEDRKREAMTLGNMGLAYVSLERPEDALECYEQSARMFEALEDRKGLAQTWNNMGLTYNSMQDYPAAVSYFSRSLELSRALGARSDVCITLVNLAQVYVKMDKPREALPYAEEGRAIAEEIGARASLRDSYATLADLHAALGDHVTALDFCRKFADIKDTIYSMESGRRIAEMEVRYETAQKEKEKEIYRLRNVELVELNEQITAQKEELARTLDKLRQTQKQLVESEKMAALGSLVSGVAHEINTPVGIGITAASGIADRTESLHELYAAGRMKRSDLEKYVQFARESSRLLLSNLERTGELIQSFKQVSVDQTSDQQRAFKLGAYLRDIMRSLEPRLKPRHVEVNVACDKELTVVGYPGVLAQIVTNLALNAVVHAFKERDGGRIDVRAGITDSELELRISDNGAGMREDVRMHIFDPFFTTSRQDGTGLGLHIVYNLVTQRLQGTIACTSSVGHGTTFTIKLPTIGAAHEFGTPS